MGSVESTDLWYREETLEPTDIKPKETKEGEE